MIAITTTVIRGHRATLKALKDFASKGENILHVVPGNHDATLLLTPIWKLFQDAVGAPAGRVRLVETGVWLSADGVILVEHGHQIGSDPNRYEAWPKIVRDKNGQELVVQPWGERFVQSIFNNEEETYPIIDNLSPETAGARYRMADRGLWRTAQDMARFIAFNLFETSMQQKGAFLGAPEKNEDPKWDVKLGRDMGHLLFANALAADDPFRQALLADAGDARALRVELDGLARNPAKTSDAEVMMLCDQISIRQNQKLCETPQLGAAIEQLLVPRRRVMVEHLKVRLGQPGSEKVRVYVYGHTHLLEEAWPLRISEFIEVTVLNSGAFQRVVDEDGFLARAKKAGLTPEVALKAFLPENLAPCYTAVLVPYDGSVPKPRTVRWLADESAGGAFVSANDPRCK
jgi:UDP-2,3-diacylglucosamine pyrophosphatase LpxH